MKKSVLLVLFSFLTLIPLSTASAETQAAKIRRLEKSTVTLNDRVAVLENLLGIARATQGTTARAALTPSATTSPLATRRTVDDCSKEATLSACIKCCTGFGWIVASCKDAGGPCGGYE